MNPITYLKGAKLRSYRAYCVIVFLSWIYTLIWAAGLFATWAYWDALAIYSKVVICVVLIFLAPTGTDLIQSYQKYKEQWEQSNR